MIQCSQCNYDNKDDAQFCLNCGAPLSKVANEDGYDDVSDEATVLINPAAMQARINSEMKAKDAAPQKSPTSGSGTQQPIPQIQKSAPAPQPQRVSTPQQPQQKPAAQKAPQAPPPAPAPAPVPAASSPSNTTTNLLLGVVVVLVLVIIGLLISKFFN